MVGWGADYFVNGCVSFVLILAETEPVEVAAASALDHLCLRQVVLELAERLRRRL